MSTDENARPEDAEPATEPTATVTDVVAEPVAEEVTEPVADVVAEPVADVVAEPVTEPTEPVAEVVTGPVADVVVEPAEIPEVAEAAVGDVDEPSADVPAVPDRPVPRPSPAALAGSVRPAPPRPLVPVEAPADEVEIASDSARFGRIDDEGTVHVTDGEGVEHPVGQWAAGPQDQGLAFFTRKYDDLSVEVDLATRRLTEGKAAPEQAATVVKRAKESLASPSMVGDLASLTARVEALDILVLERRRIATEERAVAKAAALAAREAIVAEAEGLETSTQWKATGERFKTLLDEWKSAPRADRTGEQSLWKRFSHARSQFDKHRRQYFARLDGERGEAKQVKEALVAEAEALRGSTDWGATAGAYRDLMTRWKAAGRAGKNEEEDLWARFREAQDAFFATRNAAFGERDAGFAENLAAKEKLLVEAEAIDTSALSSAKSALRSIQERWEAVGHVPRGDKERIEGRLRRVEESVRTGEQDQWRRSNPEAKARADATVAQFQAALDKLEKEKAKAEAAGDARKVADADARITTTKALLEAAQRASTEFSG